MPTLHLDRPLERAILQGHPWIYEDALKPSRVAAGAVVTVRDRRDRFLARGIREGGPIGVRVWSLDGQETIDQALVERRVRQSIERREGQVGDSDAYRLVHGEGDQLPGIVVDRYGPYAVVRLEGAVAECGFVLDGLRMALRDHRGVLLRRGRKHDVQSEVFCGQAPPKDLVVREHGMRLCVNVWKGQKTGLFLDHRESRRRVRELVASMRAPRVLNLYGYTGGFSVAAGLGGASTVTTVDIAAPAIALANASWAENGLDTPHEGLASDVPKFLQTDDRVWDLIVADPPSFAPSRKALPNALAAYRKLHAACFAALREGGTYVAASCSSHVDHAMFEQGLRDAASDARVQVEDLERWDGAPDHPRLPAFPEGDYLSVIRCRRGRTLGAKKPGTPPKRAADSKPKRSDSPKRGAGSNKGSQKPKSGRKGGKAGKG